MVNIGKLVEMAAALDIFVSNDREQRVAVTPEKLAALRAAIIADLAKDVEPLRVLHGPRTHVCWTPDSTPPDQRELVYVVGEADVVRTRATVAALKAENEVLRHPLAGVKQLVYQAAPTDYYAACEQQNIDLLNAIGYPHEKDSLISPEEYAADLKRKADLFDAAAAVDEDLAGLMELYVTAADARACWMETSCNRDKAVETEAALESALRLLLAGKVKEPETTRLPLDLEPCRCPACLEGRDPPHEYHLERRGP